MKWKEPETERQPAGQTREIIDVDDIEVSQDSRTGSNERSWLWNHFNELDRQAVYPLWSSYLVRLVSRGILETAGDPVGRREDSSQQVTPYGDTLT
ncbi:hypothetical protein PGTUg99_035434 [Puccinia graminis f. sp. tritici]|uniref:Uncharacterized protein n=1 Tax=Puccinia graminis f. sp. tritici TaxID=56615 RepID=A0A5B0SLB9_PUCGR|nr:hypothetical protein PGTUg99_035434 [Puccinia graminis f. sp. tritici]